MSNASSTYRGRPQRLVVYIVLVLGAIVMLSPYALMIATSLKTYPETIANPQSFLPAVPQWSNYIEVNSDQLPIYLQIGNSAIVSIARIAGQLLFASMAAYAFARLRFRFRGLIFGIFLSMLMVPSQLFLLPQYQIMQNLHWLDTLQALAVPGMFTAFGVFLLRQFFLGLPIEIEEAARLDGANPWQIYWHVMLPLTRPALAALALLTLVASWSDLLWPLIVSSTPARMPVSAGIANLTGQYTTPFQLVMAAATIATIPVVVALLLGQRAFVRGLTAGAVK